MTSLASAFPGIRPGGDGFSHSSLARLSTSWFPARTIGSPGALSVASHFVIGGCAHSVTDDVVSVGVTGLSFLVIH